MDRGPLLELKLPPRFSAIEPHQIEGAIAHHLEAADAALKAIEAKGEDSYADTLGAMELATINLELAMGLVEHLESVANTPELRAAYNAVLPSVSTFWAGVPLRSELWAALQRLERSRQAGDLSPTQERLLERTLDDFRRHGADLDDAPKACLLEIDEALSQATAKFSQNVLDATNSFELVLKETDQLAGLPRSAVEAARHSASSKGLEGYRLTLQAPSVVSVLTYADNAELRERIWRAFNTRGVSSPTDNRQLIRRILKLRREKANLLGYRNFAALALEPRMAGSVDAARTFVDELTEKTLGFFKKETAELFAYRQSIEGGSAPPLQPWDVAYYSEKLRKDRFDFDEELLRGYFPFEATLQGLFDLSSRLFGIQFESAENVDSWHETVRAFRILDGTKELGTFYVDPYPRDNKGGGAWMHGLVPATSTEKGLAVVVCNATPPTSERPSLLTHREVETLFHEFGHLLHHLLSKVEVRSLAGTRVAQDFVELPSQIMENWCWEREALDVFAAHYETKEPIPSELFDRLRSVRTYRAASAQMRQLGFAALDLALHVDFDPASDQDVLALSRQILTRFSPAPLPEQYALIASFSHLFAHPVGYAAGYYSYKWAEVLDADAFSRFSSEGIFNAEVGREWRGKVLERGDALDPMRIFEEFMGRKPSPHALMVRQGLA